MTEKYKIYRVKTDADIAPIPFSEPIQLEIYLKNAVIPVKKITGHCLIRAVGCVFPQLEEVKGNLSIDAADVSLPRLLYVEGNCNIHETGIELPELKTIKGVLTILKPIDLPQLEVVGRKISNKTKVDLPRLRSSPSTVFEVKNKADIDKLPQHGCFSLTVRADNVTIDHEEILGTLSIIGNNIVFPNLHFAHKVLIGDSRSEKCAVNISFPVLKTIEDNCIVKAQNVFLPLLIEVGHKFLIEYNANGHFPNLEKVAIFRCDSVHKLYFPNLQYVSGDFQYKATVNIHPSVKESQNDAFNLFNLFKKNPPKVEKIEVKDEISFPNLKYVGGNIELTDGCPYPNLETVGGTAFLKTELLVFEHLKKINALEISPKNRQVPVHKPFPNIQNIKYAVYDNQLNDLIPKIEDLFLRILESVFVSSNEFFVEANWRFSNHAMGSFRNKLPIETLISILKMRHSSFQTFVTREFEREWLKPHERVNEVLKAIENKWSACPKFTFEDIFKFSDRNIRRYCFSYIGVSTMMHALDAKRIASEGIELNYFQYDTLGNKSRVTKHNIFEIYEAEVHKIQGLSSWRTAHNKVYAVKCWCTSTSHEHWLWIEAQYKNDPLEAIASTFRVHNNVIPHIKCLKRQGDVLICEMKKQVIPEGSVRPLTKKEYFSLLEVET